jgi:hypothetical protein
MGAGSSFHPPTGVTRQRVVSLSQLPFDWDENGSSERDRARGQYDAAVYFARTTAASLRWAARMRAGMADGRERRCRLGWARLVAAKKTRWIDSESRSRSSLSSDEPRPRAQVRPSPQAATPQHHSPTSDPSHHLAAPLHLSTPRHSTHHSPQHSPLPRRHAAR